MAEEQDKEEWTEEGMRIDKSHFAGIRTILHYQETYNLRNAEALIINDELEEYQLVDADGAVLTNVDF